MRKPIKYLNKRTLIIVARAAAALGIICGGCAEQSNTVALNQAQMNEVSQEPQALQPFYMSLASEGPRNAVLNEMECGLAASELRDFDRSERCFDDALNRIETVYATHSADAQRAAQARSLWYDEGAKDFKGEPYERVMAYYYRGLLYLRHGDYGNAQACFKGGIVQDSFAEEQNDRSSFALVIFLAGWSLQRMGDTNAAQSLYAEAKLLRPDLNLPPARDNLLVIAETGTAPRKVSDGIGHAELKFRRGKEFTESRAAVVIGSTTSEMYPIEDIALQANSRGGRQIDQILDGKVQFAEGATLITQSSASLSFGAVEAASVAGKSSGAVMGVGAGLGLVAGVSDILASNVKAEADTRYWANLPDTVHVFTTHVDLDSPPRTVDVHFQDSAGNELPELTKSAVVDVTPDKSGALAWARSQSAFNCIGGKGE